MCILLPCSFFIREQNMFGPVSVFPPRILIIWLLLTLLNDPRGLGQADGNLQVNGILGQSVTLPVNLPWTDPSIITWDFRNSSTAKKVQVCTKTRNSPAECNNDLGQRVRLNLTDYSLEIQTLIKSDQGWYETNARSGQGVHVEVMELRVYERLSNPTIQINNVSSNGICNVSLSCVVENNSDLNYTWWRGAEMITSGEPHSMPDNLWNLEVSLNLHDNNTIYKCTVKNPVSEEAQSIDLAMECDMEGNKARGNQQLHIGLIIAGITIFIFILITIFFVLRKKHPKPNEAPNTEGTSEPAQYAVIRKPICARVQSQEHLCQLDANERQQSQGVQLTTIYDEIKFNPDVSTPKMVMQKGQEASANA
ncbi:SLAM family member 9-like isoform X1 [Cetorhinus maximus]